MREESHIWFPEPTIEDDSFAGKDEDWFAWISRATSNKGKACRQFLNTHISKVPSSWQSKLYGDLRTREWHSVLFELIVGRTLQIMGASIEVEVPNQQTNKRPDFVGRFPDGAITVEATAPTMNETVNRRMSWNEELIEIIEALTPGDWSVEVWRLPKLGPNDSKQAFKQDIKRIISQLPRTPLNNDSIRIDVGSDEGDLSLTFRPGRKGKRAAPIRGVVAGADDTEQRIRAAIKRKKRQVKKSNIPVLLAVRADAFGDLEDYDQALFGSTFEHVDQNGRTIRMGFDPVGAFGKRRRQAPTYAGVLAYTAAGFPRVNDPVLYLHPGFAGVLPESLMDFEVRTLESTGVRVTPARKKQILAELNLVY